MNYLWETLYTFSFFTYKNKHFILFKLENDLQIFVILSKFKFEMRIKKYYESLIFLNNYNVILWGNLNTIIKFFDSTKIFLSTFIQKNFKCL